VVSLDTKQAQIDLVRGYLTALREEVRKLAVFPRESGAVFDKVVCGNLSKAFSLADAALVLVETGHPEEAYGLSRSIVECSISLRYLTQDQGRRESRALDFANYFYKERNYWYAQAKQFLTDPALIAEMDQYAAENGIKADAKATMAGWSGKSTWDVIQLHHPLDGTAFGLTVRKADYAVNYHSPAAYVHASDHAIHGYVKRLFYPPQKPYQPYLKSDGDEQEGQKTLYAILTHIHLAAGYAMFGMDVTDLKEMLRLYQQCLSQLDPVVQQHRPENVFRKVYW
jgi:hypothetical protein